jgi:hypothetical protein
MGVALRRVDSPWGGELDNPQPDRDVDEDFVQPPADAYKAVIKMDGTKYHLRASKVKEWEVPQHFSNFSISFVDLLFTALSPRSNGST